MSNCDCGTNPFSSSSATPSTAPIKLSGIYVAADVLLNPDTAVSTYIFDAIVSVFVHRPVVALYIKTSPVAGAVIFTLCNSCSSNPF